MDYEVITMLDDLGDEIKFTILDAIKHNDTNYILATENYDDDVSEAVIFKETNEDNNDVIFELVEDEEELIEVSGLFADNDDFELQL